MKSIEFTRFVITIPFYNAEKYIEECLNSVISQNYKNFRAIVVDDCSTDDSWNIAKNTIRGEEKFFVMIKNKTRVGSPLSNIIKATNLPFVQPEDVIVNLDGDDALSDSDVLFDLLCVYNNSEIWATFGQSVPFSRTFFYASMPFRNTTLYRESGVWNYSHLRTYKKWLFDKIKDEDLRDKDGEYYKRAGDCALIYPIVEMCGKEHAHCLKRISHFYNDLNEINEGKVNLIEQERSKNRIRSIVPYEPI